MPQPIIGANYFWTPEFLWFYIYFALVTALFCGLLVRAIRRIPGQHWSILGSALILFSTYFSVQVSVAHQQLAPARSSTRSSRR